MMMDQTCLKEYLEKYVKRFADLHAALLKEDPKLGLTALVMSQDIISAEQVTEELKQGRGTAEQLVWRVGSFCRLDWAIAHCADEFVLKNLPELWMSSDQDDTRPEYLALWRRAFERNGRRVICDKKNLPSRYRYHLFRGQERDEPQGISWTLDRSVAFNFARGAAVRRPLEDGVVLERFAHPGLVLAYLTGRDESEVIIDLEVE